SMGNDIADINNDGLVDIVSLDMMPGDHETFMRSGGSDLVVVEQTKKEFGFGSKNSRNTMQVNRGFTPQGGPVFSEMAFTLGMARTDWSWAALFADLNNNGYKDLFVTNGMVGRPNDMDYIRVVGNTREEGTETDTRVSDDKYETIEYMPPVSTPNYLFKNRGNLQFENVASEWGLDSRTFSSGAVYADLDNNGMLDLVVNNVNEETSVYRNNAKPDSTSNYLKIKLNGDEFNTSGIGTKVMLYADDQIFMQEQMPTRGFQSSVDHVLHIGLGETPSVDSLRIIWPDGQFEVQQKPDINQKLDVSHSNASGVFDYSNLKPSFESSIFRNVSDLLHPDMIHEENEYNDFSEEPLLPYKLSREGPAIALGDVTGNGREDLFIGNGYNRSSKLFLQQNDGRFRSSNQELFENDFRYEDVAATFFDATGNGLPDLYVVSGGSQLFDSDVNFRDRLYINNGDGTFEKSAQNLPEPHVNGSVVKAADFNADGAIDLFIGGRSKPWNYGQSPEHTLLMNDGSGRFENVTQTVAPGMDDLGLVTDALWVDFTGNGFEDLVVVGEWMPVTIFENREGYFENVTDKYGLKHTNGLWQSVEADDLDNDGRVDLVVGNFGTNTRMVANETNPLHLYVKDFEDSGYTSGIFTQEVGGKEVPFEQLDELLQEVPRLTQQISSYRDFASKTAEDLFGEDEISEASKKHITELRSVAIFNRENSETEITPLPVYAQSFPVKDIEIFSGRSGIKQLLLAGNHYDVKPSFSGRQDAGYGLHLTYMNDHTFETTPIGQSGFYVNGDSRSIHPFSGADENKYFLVTRNDGKIELFSFR
ncbi:MAG: VCBS repeat-containing protein, partial [Bacteroidota bacterium]